MDQSAKAAGRDGLGRFCFWLHMAVLAFIAGGWALPWHGVLLVYLIFLPLVIGQWRINRDACVLNNAENWLRHRRWRAPETNAEEGAWLRTLLRRVSGLALSKRQMDLVIYFSMGSFWAVALVRFLRS